MHLVGEMQNSRNYEEMSQAIIQAIHTHPARTEEGEAEVHEEKESLLLSPARTRGKSV